MEKHTLDFWYEFASTYSYLAAERIEPLARKKGVTVNWRPFLLGPIFHAQGWNSSPFKIYKVKGDYMWRDMERLAERYGLPFRIPVANELPQHSVLAARVWRSACRTTGREPISAARFTGRNGPPTNAFPIRR